MGLRRLHTAEPLARPIRHRDFDYNFSSSPLHPHSRWNQLLVCLQAPPVG